MQDDNTDSRKENKNLTVRLGKSRFSFAIDKPAADAGFRYEEYDTNSMISMVANIKEAMETEPLLKENYRKVRFLVPGDVLSVPLDEFEDEQAENVYSFSFPMKENEEVVYNVLSHVNVVLLFAVERGLRQILLDEYPNAVFSSRQGLFFISYIFLFLYFHNGNWGGCLFLL